MLSDEKNLPEFSVKIFSSLRIKNIWMYLPVLNTDLGYIAEEYGQLAACNWTDI
jgi:hypothetical protein